VAPGGIAAGGSRGWVAGGTLGAGPQKLPTGKHSYSAALARFDTLLNVLRTIVLSYRAVKKFVAYQHTQIPGPWAEKLLAKFSGEDAECELAALTEFFEIASAYVHKDEGHTGETSNMLEAYGDFLDMIEEMEAMFGGGRPGRHPRCTSQAYSRGYYQLLKKQMLSLGEEFSYRGPDGTVLYSRRKKNAEEEALSIARVMKKMHHVINVFREASRVDLLMARDLSLYIYIYI
jgi:hypothetical protein